MPLATRCPAESRPFQPGRAEPVVVGQVSTRRTAVPDLIVRLQLVNALLIENSGTQLPAAGLKEVGPTRYPRNRGGATNAEFGAIRATLSGATQARVSSWTSNVALVLTGPTTPVAVVPSRSTLSVPASG